MVANLNNWKVLESFCTHIVSYIFPYVLICSFDAFSAKLQ